MKAAVLVLCSIMTSYAHVAHGARIEENSTLTSTDSSSSVTNECTEAEKNKINALESTVSYNKCRRDAQKAIFDGNPKDICVVPSCVDAVQDLVGRYPNCVFDTVVKTEKLALYYKDCNVDPNRKPIDSDSDSDSSSGSGSMTLPPETSPPRATKTPAVTPDSDAASTAIVSALSVLVALASMMFVA